jgi:peroxisomal 2,4-dienoyl-CoA reductase
MPTTPCDVFSMLLLIILGSAGAAGNFLASIEQLSANAFKSVMDIDILGSYNTLKATLPYLKESGNKHRMDNKSRE